MADANDSEAQNTPAPGPQRRQRAPTITIDTSAVTPNNTNMGDCVFERPSPTPSVHAEQPMSACSEEEEDLEDDLDDIPEYHVPQYTHEPLPVDTIPSTPRDFADLFPTAKRISIRHDDSTMDGNMNLRVDTQVEERHHKIQNYTLFHLRMHELRTREFSLRRYCRDSGREVCRPTRKHQSSNSQSFLAVPGPRSRGNSRILDDKSTSSGTYIPSSQGDSVLGDHNPNQALNDKGALKPDPDTEAGFEVESNKFAFSPGQLGKMFNPKSLAAFHALGGLDGLERGLKTDRKAGLSADEQYLDGVVSFEEATAPTTSNVPPKLLRDGALDGRDPTPDDSNEGSFADHRRQRKSIFKLAWMAYNDKVLILLTAAAVVSLALGLFQTLGEKSFGAEHEPGIPKVKWAEGVAVLVAILSVAVPEGFPLAVVSALAFATTRMLKDNNLVRALGMDGAMDNATTICSDRGSDSEAMGNATTICSHKTGTLTQNKMTVVAGTLGTALKFGDKKHASNADDDDMSPSEFVSTLNPDVKDLLLQSIVQNSTAFEGEDDVFIGSKTETALLHFARDHLQLRTGSLNAERWNANVVQVVPFDSARKCCAVVVKLDDGRYRMYVKGASEILLGKCDRMVSEHTQDFLETSISVDKREALEKDIETYASRSLRTIGLVYRDFESWPPTDSRVDEDNSTLAIFEDVFKEMVFLAVMGIHDPLRKSATFRHSQHNGVTVRMVTGDNVLTARAIAKDCGIGGVTMEGPDFQNLSKRDMDTILPKLRVLARSSPEDKRMLVRHLKALGENVAVTGDVPPVLKAADMGFSMGIAGTEVAREASAIILMDDNFASIIKGLYCSRAINDATKDFLSCSVAAKLLTMIPAFAATNLSPTVSSLLQFLGVNLIMETLAALNSRSTVLGRLMPKALVVPIYTSSTPKYTRRRHGISLPGFSTLMASSLFIPGTAAQTTPSTADENWRQRALDTLSELIVSCAVLLAPTIILIIAGCIVLILLWLEAEGTLSLFMLGMASIFATIRPSPEPSQPDDDCYIRLAVGLSYILFMLAYCRLVVLRHRHGKVFSTIAVVLAVLSTTTAMAIPPVREYWIALTNLNPTFALSLAIPSSFFLADLAVYIIVAVNHHMDKDELSSPARLEASVGGSLAADSSIPRDRTYRIRNIPIRRFRSPYGSGSGSVEEGNDASTSLPAATRTSQPRQTRRLRISS